MEKHHRQQTIEYVQLRNLLAFNTSQLLCHQQKHKISSKNICPNLKGDAQLWYLHLGHPGPISLHHLSINALKVKL